MKIPVKAHAEDEVEITWVEENKVIDVTVIQLKPKKEETKPVLRITEK